MIYPDDETRHAYHKTPLLLQVVCQMLESELSAYHLQLELVDCEEQEKFWVALLVAGNEHFEDSPHMQHGLKQAVASLNAKFTRYDGKPTASVEQGNYGLVTVRVTDSKAFKQLQ